MSTLELLTGPEAQALGWALVHLLWQGALVAGILAAALAILPRQSATLRYAASCAAMAVIFVLFVGTVARSWDPEAARLDPLPSGAFSSSATPSAGTQQKLMLSDVPAAIVATAAAGWRERAFETLSGARKWLPSVVAIWLTGVLILSSRLLMTWIRARRLARHGATPAAAGLQHTASRLASALGLRRAVILLESVTIDVPAVIGVFRPVVLIPASTLTGLTPGQIEMVLAHELAHIRRHDFLINLMQAVAETLLFYHPAVWWVSGQIRVERENCCDDLALAVCGDRAQYARALARLEELRDPASSLLVAATGGSLLDRIRRIAGRGSESNPTARWAAAVASLTLVAGALALTSLPALAQRDTPPAAPAPPAARVDVVAPSGEPAPEPAAEESRDEDSDHDYDFDFDFDEGLDIESPRVPMTPPAPGSPVVAPAPVAAVGRVAGVAAVAPVAVPRPPGTPHPAAAPMMAAAFDFDFDFDSEFEDEDDEELSEADRRLRAEGKFTVDELIRLRAVGVTPEYIAAMRAAVPGLPIRRLASFRALGVTPEFVREMRSIGFDTAENHAIERLKAAGVTAGWVREMKAAGVAIRTAHDAASLRHMQVDPAFVRKLADAGYKDLSVRDLLRLAAAGVDGEFIREMSKYREKQ